MIENSVELRVAARQLRILEQARHALNDQLTLQNPWLLGISEPAYLQHIRLLQSDIAAYLCEHPADVSLLLSSPDANDMAEIDNAAV